MGLFAKCKGLRWVEVTQGDHMLQFIVSGAKAAFALVRYIEVEQATWGFEWKDREHVFDITKPKTVES